MQDQGPHPLTGGLFFKEREELTVVQFPEDPFDGPTSTAESPGGPEVPQLIQVMVQVAQRKDVLIDGATGGLAGVEFQQGHVREIRQAPCRAGFRLPLTGQGQEAVVGELGEEELEERRRMGGEKGTMR